MPRPGKLFFALAHLLACASDGPDRSSFGLSGGGLQPTEAASDDDSGPASGSDESTSSSSSSASSSTSSASSSSTTSSATTAATHPGCTDPCDDPPGPCDQAQGVCFAGQCEYQLKPPGAPCQLDDPCASGGVGLCDEDGLCSGGAPIDCARPNAVGGTCLEGQCGGWTCVEPWEDCDGDMDNGCEVPTGVANQCDAQGLNPEGGCWTAYCGALDDPKATNFGAFFCYSCSTCHSPEPGLVQWCNHSTGLWYPLEMNTCGAWLDLVCAPG